MENGTGTSKSALNALTTGSSINSEFASPSLINAPLSTTPELANHATRATTSATENAVLPPFNKLAMLAVPHGTGIRTFA